MLKIFLVILKVCASCLDYVENNNLSINKCGLSTVNHYLFALKYPLDNYFSIKDWINYYYDFFSTKKKIRYVKRVIKKRKSR